MISANTAASCSNTSRLAAARALDMQIYAGVWANRERLLASSRASGVPPPTFRISALPFGSAANLPCRKRIGNAARKSGQYQRREFTWRHTSRY
jgi:hypothetical protein